jgi:hypothetical protein
VSSMVDDEGELESSREERETDDEERLVLVRDDGRVSGYDGTSGILDTGSKLPKYCVVGLADSESGGSGARNGTDKLRDGALRHREKKGVKYPRTTTAASKQLVISHNLED